LGKVKAPGVRNEVIAGSLVLSLVRILQVGFETGPDIVAAFDPIYVGNEVLLGIGISLRLEGISWT
jgi:hypothetical protein